MPKWKTALQAIRKRPVLTASACAAILLGTLGTIGLSPDDWSLLRKVMLGVFASSWFVLLLVGGRILLMGGSEEDY